MTGDQDQTDLSAGIKAGATRYKAPPGLQRDIRIAISQAAAATARPPAPGWRSGAAWLRLGAAFACGILLSLLALQLGVLHRATDPLAGEVVAAHVRSMMVAHLEDIASTDQHTVKPWFAGKLDYSPPVVDLAGQGFPLAGGRLDYIGRRPVAALIYRRRGHAINVFVWPIRDSDRPRVLATSRDGYQVIALGHAGMQYWIVSDLNGEELQQFSKLLEDDGEQSRP